MVKYILPQNMADKWAYNPAIRMVEKAGIWTRSRLKKNEFGNWERVGRLVKKVYKAVNRTTDLVDVVTLLYHSSTIHNL